VLSIIFSMSCVFVVAEKYASDEPSLITDVRLEILSHGKDYDSIKQALCFVRYHLKVFSERERIEQNAESKTQTDPKTDDNDDDDVDDGECLRFVKSSENTDTFNSSTNPRRHVRAHDHPYFHIFSVFLSTTTVK